MYSPTFPLRSIGGNNHAVGEILGSPRWTRSSRGRRRRQRCQGTSTVVHPTAGERYACIDGLQVVPISCRHRRERSGTAQRQHSPGWIDEWLTRISEEGGLKKRPSPPKREGNGKQLVQGQIQGSGGGGVDDRGLGLAMAHANVTAREPLQRPHNQQGRAASWGGRRPRLPEAGVATQWTSSRGGCGRCRWE